MILLHDDTKREYAYGPAQGLPDIKVGTFTQACVDKRGRFCCALAYEMNHFFMRFPDTTMVTDSPNEPDLTLEEHLQRKVHWKTVGLLGMKVAGIPDEHDPRAFGIVCTFMLPIAVRP